MSSGVLDRLETERLILRPSEEGDATTFRTMWTERDPRVPPHRRIGPDGRPTEEDIAARIRAELEEVWPLKLLTVERRSGGVVVGYCGLTPQGNGSPEEPELAFELLRSAQGAGLATEAASAVVSWAAAAGYRRLWAGVWDWNVASRRVLEKLEFCETGQITTSSSYGRSLLTVRELQAAQDPQEPTRRGTRQPTVDRKR